ncbi:hypothetical protein MPSEU_000338100 [Mayamaea pseudoterrestris]|nr:hypothetical protein MPSEU_000338100 [Mayamaea pseudoterrestris]
MNDDQSGGEDETAATIAAFQQLSRTPPAASDDAVASIEAMPSTTLASFVGFGIDANFQSAANDATVTAAKAVLDALDRAAVTMRMLLQQNDLQIQVKLGVPAKPTSGDEPLELMSVDVERLRLLVPPNIQVLPFNVSIGGLVVAEENFCASIALLGIYTTSPNELQARTGVIVPPSTWDQVEQQQQQVSDMMPQPAMVVSSSSVGARPDTMVHRSTSIDMLARISSQIHETAQPIKRKTIDDSSTYRKLPPIAVTSERQTKRLLVRHDYRDYSKETPQHGELEHIVATNTIEGTPALSSTSWAFPLKLHETLHQIESEGNGDIFGWLPHGRSFKIFKQKEFVDVVLPRYFVMTKKSSFLRQLNLYHFKRLCRPGPDQQSYYHPLFLRGKKFLAKRMQREKVNGNGIRTAGNPTEEPNLGDFPPLPMVAHKKVDASMRATRTAAQKKAVTPPVPVAKVLALAGTAGQPLTMEALKASQPKADSLSKDLNSIHAAFPLRLQRILDKLEADGETDVMSWLPHGRAFIVRDVNRFVNELSPVHFNQSRYASFQRQLHMYGFSRITKNLADKGAYHNPNFLRGRPELAFTMRRTRVNGKGTRQPGDPQSDPDFYKCSPIPPIPRGTSIPVPLERNKRSQADQSDEEDDDEDSGSMGSFFDT